jgi:methyl-accepting chemotaxis protein
MGASERLYTISSTARQRRGTLGDVREAADDGGEVVVRLVQRARDLDQHGGEGGDRQERGEERDSGDGGHP